MSLQVLPNLQLPAKQVFILNRFWLKLVVGYTEIDGQDGAGNTFGELLTGVAGSVLSDEPSIFRDGATAFLAGHVGKYLVTHGSTNAANNGIWLIAAVPDGGTLILATTLHGPRFVSDVGIDWSIVDPTLIVGGAMYVMEAPAPAGTAPPWQVHFLIQGTDTLLFRYEVGPLGGWNSVGHVWGTASFTPERQIQQDTTGLWWILADSTHIYGWTENTVGTGVYSCWYAGSAQTFRTANDPNFAIATNGNPDITPTGLLNSIDALAQDNVTPAVFTSLKPVDTFLAPPSDNFVGGQLQPSQFDLRHDAIDIPIAGDPATVPPEIRGVFRSFHYCSTLIPYKTFVSNNRSLVSLGQGICVDWDSSFIV